MSDLLDACIRALRAHKAWTIAEQKSLDDIDFDTRMELCSYAEHLTDTALMMMKGDVRKADYDGVPHLVVWPTCELRRMREDDAERLVNDILERFGEPRDAANVVERRVG